jgi:hypothetical protein
VKKVLALFIFISLACYPMTGQGPLPAELWKNTGDYTFMYFPEPVRSASEIHIQTNHHFIAFDYTNLSLRDMRVITEPLPESEAARRGLEFLPLTGTGSLLNMHLLYGGTGYTISRGCPTISDCQLIESGKYFQRRYLTGLSFESGGPQADITLEIASWPDRFSFVLEVKTESINQTDSLRLNFSVPEPYRHSMIADDSTLLALDQQGNGFVYYLPGKGNRTEVTGFDLMFSQGPLPNRDFKAEIILLPVKNYQGESLAVLLGNESGDLEVTALQLAPSHSVLNTDYDQARGWYDLFLRNDNKVNNRIERVKVTLVNNAAEERTARLNFHKTQAAGVYAITGISAIIRDNNLNPTGIPVQLSKNWHKKTGDLHEGSWFRGFTMMTIPAGTTVDFEFTLVNAMWGKLPAASHAQLCLVGWGHNQLWEESAIGAWGETVCYEPDGGQAQSMVCDVRPLMTQSLDPELKPQKWNWTPNVGGADFFRFYNHLGEKQFITRIKTHYKRYSPNLTEVTYAGVTQDNKADYELTASIYRSDDYVRAVYKVRLYVREEMEFSRLAIAQVGSESYSYTGERKFAFGDENGLIEEWETTWGGSVYRKTGLTTEGSVPWVSMHEAVNRTPSEWGSWANRGLVIRKWNAQIGGEMSKPYFSEYGAVARGSATSLVEINPAPGIKSLQPGDFIEADIVEIILPQEAGTYYGPNPAFFAELSKNADTWKLVHREAVGNRLSVTATKGTVQQLFPVVVEVNELNEAEVEVQGGIGFVPFTFTGLTSHDQFSIKIMKDGEEIILNDQEQYGKDYWQTDYDPASGTWEITYSVPLDSTWNFISEQSSILLYNDFDQKQHIPWSAPSSLTFTDKVDNPNLSEGNASPKVAKIVRESGVHANVRFQLPDYLDLSENSTFRVKVYFEGEDPPPPVANVRLILRNNNSGPTQYALTQAVKSSNRWEEYTFNCAGAVGRDTYNQVYLFFCSPDNDGTSEGLVFYIDDLMGPPLTIDTDLVEMKTSERGDSIIIDLSGNNQKMSRIVNPVFVLNKKGDGSVIKTDSLTSDSTRLFLHVNEKSRLTGRDVLTLSYISGEIIDEKGKILAYFYDKEVTNTIPVTEFIVKFVIRNEKTGEPVADAGLTSGDASALTNNLGEATFVLSTGSHEFTVLKSDYFMLGTAVEISSDTTIDLFMQPSVATVTFSVTDDAGPLQNASILLGQMERATDDAGTATFENFTVFQEYDYVVDLNGYESENGVLYLTQDTAVLVVLSPVTGRSEETAIETVHPNPFTENIWVNLAGPAEMIIISDLAGISILKFSDLAAGQHLLDMSSLSGGVYTMRICYASETRALKIIKMG